MYKRIFFTVISLVAVMSSLLFTKSVLAVDIGIGNGGSGIVGSIADKSGYTVQGVDDTTLSATIGRVIKVALSLLGTIFFALTVYAGILWTTAGGNGEQVEKATSIIKTAVTGLVLVMAAYGITVFVLVATMKSTGAGSTSGGFWDYLKSNWWRLFF